MSGARGRHGARAVSATSLAASTPQGERALVNTLTNATARAEWVAKIVAQVLTSSDGTAMAQVLTSL